MKFIAYILLAVFFFSILLNPFIELFSEFNDKCRIGSAMKVSCRNAVLNSADENVLKDVEAKLKTEDFEKNFIESFCISMDLSNKYPNDYHTLVSNHEKYNDFEVDFNWLDSNKCEIDIKTAYKFKTGIFKRFFGETAESSPTYIELTRRQTLNVEN